MGLFFQAVVALTVLLFVLGFAAASRRLLGVQFGLVRTLLAGALAYAVSGPLFRAFAGAPPTSVSGLTPLWFLILAMATSVLAAMVFLVVAEAFIPTGSIPGPLQWGREVRGRLSRLRRYGQILAIAIRHGLGPYLRGSRRAELDAPSGRAGLARSLRQALDEGGVTFVKVGQLLSTRRDLLPAEFADELSRLQDQVAPASWDQIEQVLVAELGCPVDDVFAAFDREPLAAASVAQVHGARLRSGADVVVKVQRAGIRTVVERDLDIVARLARRVESSTRWGRAIGARDLAQGFAAAMREELDFRIEATNMGAVAAAVAARGGDAGVRVPVLHRSLSTQRVLVMQRLDGT